MRDLEKYISDLQKKEESYISDEDPIEKWSSVIKEKITKVIQNEKSLTTKELSKLAKDPREHIRAGAAGNENTPREVLLALKNDRSMLVWDIATNNIERVEEVGDENTMMWLYQAYKPSEINKEDLLKIARENKNPTVLKVLYENGNDGGNNPTGRRIEAYDIKEVCEALANNAATPVDIKDKIDRQWGDLLSLKKFYSIINDKYVGGRIPLKIGGVSLNNKQRLTLQEGKPITIKKVRDKQGRITALTSVRVDKKTGLIKVTPVKKVLGIFNRPQAKKSSTMRL
jgi:hypothetical protein